MVKCGVIKAVLGIDAAWTATQPSGVALVEETDNGWRLLAVEASYQRFLSLASGSAPESRPSGSIPDASELLQASTILFGQAIDLVAIDMPMSLKRIVGRRESDNKVSREFGAKKCGTHSPSAVRPGRISDTLRKDFAAAGYELQTAKIAIHGLIEVYPHPALVELANAKERLTYKAGRSRNYWPYLTPSERQIELHREWSKIISLLDSKISGVATRFKSFRKGTSGIEMKATEDMLDAVICAWVAICALEGTAKPYGDEKSAIWIPVST